MSEVAIDLEYRQSDVHYVFAKVFKSLSTQKRLGYPAYSISYELLGFYQESKQGANGLPNFYPIHRFQEFGPAEMQQATEILKRSLKDRSQAVYDLKNWDGLKDMIMQAFTMQTDFSSYWGDNSNSSVSGSGEIEIGSPSREFVRGLNN